MVPGMNRRGRVARWVACAVVGVCALVGVGVPASVADRLPTPSGTVTQAPEPPLLPGHVITIRVRVEQTTVDTPQKTREWSIHLYLSLYGMWSKGEKITAQECQELADTFWSGSADDYFARVSMTYGCHLDAYYMGEARHAFYSLDDAGHVQVRVPMAYLHQIASSFEDASIDSLEVSFTSINNAYCNASPSNASFDKPLPVGHWSTCWWRTDDGAMIPTTDDPLLEGDVEQAFFDFEKGTVGPFIDMPAPINPFTITPAQADEPASGATDADVESPSASRGLLITIATGAALLLVAGAAAITWKHRRTN